jgi:hypothetical protein
MCHAAAGKIYDFCQGIKENRHTKYTLKKKEIMRNKLNNVGSMSHPFVVLS